MGITVDGNSITIEDCTLTFNNAFDPTTGVASITITPKGGLGTLPALLDGQPGPPPNIIIGTVTTLPAGHSASASLSLFAPGGPGMPSTYQLNLGVPEGAAGSPGNFLLNEATDFVEGTYGAIQNLWGIIYNTVTGEFNPAPPFVPKKYYATSINSTSGTGAGPRTLTTVTVPAQSYAWYPTCASSCVVSGTANTQVNLQAYLGSTDGTLVAVDYGSVGTASQTLRLQDGLPAGSSLPSIAAGVSQTIVLVATQVAATSDAWSTADTSTTFSVTATPHG